MLGVNSDRQGKSFSFALRSIAEAQQELSNRLKNLSVAAESIGSEELDRLFQEMVDFGKNSNGEKDILDKR